MPFCYTTGMVFEGEIVNEKPDNAIWEWIKRYYMA